EASIGQCLRGRDVASCRIATTQLWRVAAVWPQRIGLTAQHCPTNPPFESEPARYDPFKTLRPFCWSEPAKPDQSDAKARPRPHIHSPPPERQPAKRQRDQFPRNHLERRHEAEGLICSN